MSIIRITKKFRSILSRRQKFRIIELAFIMIFGGFLEMCSVSLVVPFMNMVMDPNATMQKWYVKTFCGWFHITDARDFLIVAAILLAALYILKNLYLIWEYNVQYRFVYGNMFEMQRRILDKFIHRPYEFFLSANSGDIIRVVNSDTASTFSLLTTLLIMFSELIVSGMLIITVFIITPLATLIIAGVMALLLVLINAVIKPIMKKAGVESQNAGAGMYKWLLQSIQGIKEVKVMEAEPYFQSNYDLHGYQYVKALRKSSVIGMFPRFMIEALSMGTMFIIVAILIYGDTPLETIVPMLTAVAMAAMRLLPSVNRISNSLAQMAYTEPMLDKLIENLNDMDSSGHFNLGSREELLSEIEEIHTGDVKPLKKRIALRDILFYYPNTEKNILSGASMEIRRGESVGIVGPSGSGKSTTVDILLGLLMPQKGQILVDQVDVHKDLHGWRSQIGYIPQSIFMLDDTIRKNVCFGVDDKDISEEQLWYALQEAALADFVRTLPEGVETQIGERGVRLSGGQRQRIGIARALYRNPSVLVFDEATSALDNNTETEIMDSIHRLHGQKTMIIIAHRLTTIEACDHIYRVENGKITKER